MTNTATLTLLAALLICPLCVGQSCSYDKPQYDELAGQLIIRTKLDAVRLNNGDHLDQLTSRLHAIVASDIRKQIESGRSDEDIRAYLQCLQRTPESEVWAEESNLPQAFEIKSNVPIRIFTYWLIRGGNAIPSTKPYLDVFRKEASGWVASTFEPGYVGSTFFVRVVDSPDRGRLVVLSGFHIGDPQTGLSIEILRSQNGVLREVYRSNPLPRTRVLSIGTDGISLEEDTSGRPRQGESSRIINLRFEDILRSGD